MPPSAIGKRAGATVALECSFPKREPKNSDFARNFYMSCVGRKIWGDAAPDAFPRDWEAHWCGGSAEEALSMRRPTNAICAQLFSYRVESRGTFEQRQTWRLI